MVGTIQVQSCKQQANLTIRCNKTLPPGSLSNAKNEHYSGNTNESSPKKSSREVRNVGSEGEQCSIESTCQPPSNTSSVGQPNGNIQKCCRKQNSEGFSVSGKERRRKKAEEHETILGKGGGSDASVRKMVLKSIEQNSNRSVPSCVSSLDNPITKSSLTSCDYAEDSLSKAIRLTEEKSCNSKLASHKQYFSNVNRTMSTKGSTQTTVQSAASDPPGQSSQVYDRKQRLNDMVVKSTTDNETYLKASKSDASESHVSKPKVNIISHSTMFDPSYSKFGQTAEPAMGPLPRVPEQPCFDTVCNTSAHLNDCSCKFCTCPTTENCSVVDIYDGNVVNITELDTNSRGTIAVGEAGVQTSFASFQRTPCYPQSCPKRKPKAPKALVSRVVQTDSTPWFSPKTVESKTALAPNKIAISTGVKLSIPPKRSRPMEDRLLRRILYFDSNPTSICNKDVEFSLYRIHRSMKTLHPDKHSTSTSNKVSPACIDKRAKNALIGPHLACDEIAIQVVSLELSAHIVSQLLKSCFFVYIDYVFLGHVGNETNLAPISTEIHFDSRISYCVSLKFNKKERSILREQINPTGLLAKDAIMFILVCHAAPEYDMLKNWDFAYGYLSLKSFLEERDEVDTAKSEVEMIKIGSTEKIGKLNVIFEGLEQLKTVRDEDIECVQQRAGQVLSKATVKKRAIKVLEHNS